MQIQGVWLLQPADSWYAPALFLTLATRDDPRDVHMLQEMLRLAKHRLFQPDNGLQSLTSLSVLLTPAGDTTVQYPGGDAGGVAGGALVGISLVGIGAIVDGGDATGM